MADYATVQALCELYGYTEIAATSAYRDLGVVPPTLLRATVEATDRTEFSTEQQAAADKAVTRIGSVIDEAEEQINATLRTVGLTVPLSAPGPLIRSLASRIARYALHRDKPNETVRQNYEDAMSILESITKGELVLDATIDGDAETGVDEPAAYTFGEDDLDDNRTFSAARLANYARNW